GILRQSKGKVLINGEQPGVYTKSIVSYLPDRNFLYEWMDIKGSINFYKDFYDDFDQKKAYELLDFMKLNPNMKTNELSKGMQEKLNLTLVLARDAKVHIFDEPIAGVDPVARDQILNAIIENYNKENTIIITTQLVRDMENIFDDVIFLREGVVELQGNAEDLREERNMQIDDIFKEIFR